MLVRLMYASRAADGSGADEMAGILKQARQHNPPLGITGLLCHSGGIYLQVLEGGRAAVSGLYNRIAQDARHHDVELLRFEEVGERCFAGWSMGQVALSRLNPALLLRFSARAELDPFAVPGAVTAALLAELVATASVMSHG